MEKKTAWNDVLNNRFLGSWDVPSNGTLIAKITKALEEDVENFQTYKSEKKLVIHLQGLKPMICNITNSKAISKALKSKYLEDWIGKNIEIEVKQVKVKKDWVDALRVKDVAPSVVKENLTTEHKHYEAIKNALKEGKTTIEAMKDKYEISNEITLKLK